MQSDNTISPAAARVIAKCGGVASTAKMLGRSKSWVYKWTYPKDRNGRGGIVPHEDAQALLEAAPRMGIDLSPADFFDLPLSTERLKPSPDIPEAVLPAAR
jgi:hypothetical protein